MRRHCSGELVVVCRVISVLTDPIFSWTSFKLASSVRSIERLNQPLRLALVYNSSGVVIRCRKCLARCANALVEVKLLGSETSVCDANSALVVFVNGLPHCSSGVAGSGSWSAHAGSHTLTLVCAAWHVSEREANERG